jgi:hypothetical protein
MPYASSLAVEVASLVVAFADNTAAADSSIEEMADTCSVDMADWVAIGAGTACWVEAASAVGVVEAAPILDFGDSSLEVAPIVVTTVVVALVDCSSSFSSRHKTWIQLRTMNILEPSMR